MIRPEPAGELDLLVVGSGVAGLSAAMRAATAGGLRTGLVTKGDLDDATTRWAQGGVAAALGSDPRGADSHMTDTLAAGAGLCDPDAVRVLVDEGPGRLRELMALGAVFDRDAQGHLELAREGGHSVPRVIHAGGAATGAEIERALTEAVRATAVAVHTRTFLEDLVLTDGVCTGAVCLRPDGTRVVVRARNVLLAAGGAGQLFSVTTNPSGATGDGVAAAMRAGAAVGDLEFLQFHPTALRHDRSPRPLLTEALRGHGAKLLNPAGARFVDELLPRDVVSRAILAEMHEHDVENVWLDARGLRSFATRFPTIAAVLDSVGLDPGRDLLPVHPAAHHLCGGVLTDLDGATSVEGLWACGEVACTGVHGANRLASNSLLEGMVFAPRVVEAILDGRRGPDDTGAMGGRGLPEPRHRDRAVEGPPNGAEPTGAVPWRFLDHVVTDPTQAGGEPGGSPRTSGVCAHGDPPQHRTQLLERLQVAMTTGAGVRRSGDSLGSVGEELDRIATELHRTDTGACGGDGASVVASAELSNLLLLARSLVAAADARCESRGTHWREDHPRTDLRQRVRIVPRATLRSGPSGAGSDRHRPPDRVPPRTLGEPTP